MKRFVGIISIIALLVLSFSALAETGFDMKVFKNQESVVHPGGSQWYISVDDMEAMGFICPNYSGEDKATISGTETVVVSPDIILTNYGQADCVPYPRIWLYYYANTWLFATDAIIKIGDRTFPFSNISIDRNTINGQIEEKLLCLCTDTEFMDAWIENTADVKIRIKSKTDSRDFYFPEDQRKNIAAMFKAFKDAGGYSYFS